MIACFSATKDNAVQLLGGYKEVLDDWAATAEVVRETARAVFG